MIIAGGAEPTENFHSHLVHVQKLLSIIEQRGIPVSEVGVFWADGEAKGADRAIERGTDDPRSWLIYGTPLDDPTTKAPELVNTIFLPPIKVLPARRATIQAWLRDTAPSLGIGDTLLIAVTDHGEPDPNGRYDSRINLWNETWSVEQFLSDLAPIPDAARVVLWMSQCYSGGFAELHHKRANLCGVFSAAADRPAYGCYPGLAAREDVGHFMRMATALGRNGNIAHAHDEVLLSDRTPDTPHLTSDVFLFEALARVAERQGTTVERFINGRLASVPPTDSLWRITSRLASRFGLGAVRDYSEALNRLDEINEIGYALDVWNTRWQTSFVQAKSRLAEPLLPSLGHPRTERSKARKRAEMIDKLDSLSRVVPGLRARLDRLRSRVEEGLNLADRLALQEAAAERAAYLMTRLAGRAGLPIDDRTRYAELRACELAPLWAPNFDPTAAPVPKAPLPGLNRARQEVDALRPAYLGVVFRDRPKGRGVVIEQLVPGGPGIGTELQVGDVIDSVNGVELDAVGAFRESVLLSNANGLVPLSVTRGEQHLDTLVPAVPMPLPARPPRIGDLVPSLELSPYDRAVGLPGLTGGKPLTLFFWSSSCKQCRRALPDLLEWARENDSVVLSITRELPSTVKSFLDSLGPRSKYGIERWPFAIALDSQREGTRLFGVDRLPVFVQIDPEGRLLEVAVGYKGAIPLAPLERRGQ